MRGYQGGGSMHRKYNDCTWIKNWYILKIEIFPNVLSKFIIIWWTFVLFILFNFRFLLMGHSFSRTFEKLLCNFFSKIAVHVFLNLIYVQSSSVIAYEVYMNFEQSIHANSYLHIYEFQYMCRWHCDVCQHPCTSWKNSLQSGRIRTETLRNRLHGHGRSSVTEIVASIFAQQRLILTTFNLDKLTEKHNVN